MRRGAIGLTLVVLFVSAEASATDVQACIEASEKGQRARSAGKLREAREQFLVCGNESCPGPVRRDCAQWNAELAQSVPTVVFGAKDRDGRDIFDVTVSMDGEPLVTKLDGKSVNVDPGRHSFRFESSGLPAVTETALIREGERPRLINVTFDSGGSGKGPDTPPPVPPPPSHSVVPWIVAGVGAAVAVAGTLVLVTSPSRPSNCNSETNQCKPLPGESADDFKRDRDQAGTADSQPVLGLVTIGIGSALLIGGLVWHFLEPTGRSAARLDRGGVGFAF